MKIYEAACDMLVQDSFKYTDASCHCFRTVFAGFHELRYLIVVVENGWHCFN